MIEWLVDTGEYVTADTCAITTDYRPICTTLCGRMVIDTELGAAYYCDYPYVDPVQAMNGRLVRSYQLGDYGYLVMTKVGGIKVIVRSREVSIKIEYEKLTQWLIAFRRNMQCDIILVNEYHDSTYIVAGFGGCVFGIRI